VEGKGSFRGDASTNPFVGAVGVRHTEPETRLELILPAWLEKPVLRAMKAAHPYEEVAYDLYALQNDHQGVGSGLVGELAEPMAEEAFIQQIKTQFGLQVLRHTPLLGKSVKTVALCGGAGSFLTKAALAVGADWYLTGDVKYHEFFDADGRMVLADLGHYESEQFTIDLLVERLQEKFPTFAVLKTGVNTNPVRYA
jgi:putative NIF3 family GTP cyclohydrolase 1 type 2